MAFDTSRQVEGIVVYALRISRRDALKRTMATLGSLMAAGCMSARNSTFFSPTGPQKLGIQLYTLGDEVWTDVGGNFVRLWELGFRELELPSNYPLPAREVRRLAEAAGLDVVSTHIDISAAIETPEEVLRACTDLGVKDAVVPFPDLGPDFAVPEGGDFVGAIASFFGAKDADYWTRTAADLNIVGAGMKAAGLRFGYHHHNMEFRPIDSRTGWDIIVAETDPDLVGFQIDTGWVSAGGLDPVEVLASIGDRVMSLHLKDLSPSSQTDYALGLATANIGQGRLDWETILAAAKQIGARHFFFEQEGPFASSRMAAATEAGHYLGSLK